ESPMSNTFSRIAIPAAIGATMALSFGAALAQSQQSGNPPTQAQPGQSSGAAADQQTGTNSMPMQGMEHGRMMRDQGQKMMQNDQSQQTGNQPSTTQAQPGQPSGTGTDQQTTGTTSTPQGMEHGRMMRDQGQKMMQNDKSMEHGQMGNPPCGPGQVQT
ncbi:MAG: hypothetical protein E6848_28165, partial [Bradyrhizobium sp.]|nr:hypothetical protein [Bradyrhizobium sp.]